MKIKRLLAAGLILFSSTASLYAEDPMPENPVSTPAPTQETIPSPVGEAGRAAVGRVFGVAGDAGDIDYYVFELGERSPRSSGIRSALVPGWGQAFNGEKVKGTVIGLSFFASALGALHYYRATQDSYDDYKARGSKSDDLYDDYESELTYASVLGGVAVLLWGYSILDARRYAYKPLYSRKDGWQLTQKNEETRLEYSHPF